MYSVLPKTNIWRSGRRTGHEWRTKEKCCWFACRPSWEGHWHLLWWWWKRLHPWAAPRLRRVCSRCPKSLVLNAWRTWAPNYFQKLRRNLNRVTASRYFDILDLRAWVYVVCDVGRSSAYEGCGLLVVVRLGITQHGLQLVDKPVNLVEESWDVVVFLPKYDSFTRRQKSLILLQNVAGL